MERIIEEKLAALETERKNLNIAELNYQNAEKELDESLFRLVEKYVDSPYPREGAGAVNHNRLVTAKAKELGGAETYLRDGRKFLDRNFGELLRQYSTKWLYTRCGGTLEVDKNDMRTGKEPVYETIEKMLDDDGNGNVIEITQALKNCSAPRALKELTGDIETFALAVYIIRNNYKKRPLKDNAEWADEHEPSDWEKMRDEIIK